MFLGLVELDDTLNAGVQTRVGDTPTAADALPTWRVYGASGLLANAGGTVTNKHTGVITGVTNTNPAVITCNSHGLQTGMRVTISGVGGSTGVNGTWVVTRIDDNTFSVAVSAGGVYTAGGAFTVTGFYNMALECSAAKGLDAGQNYSVHLSYAISGTAYVQTFSVCVV